jgi:MoaA/NifB/PqqE/SkfB family radical SAM enzyme
MNRFVVDERVPCHLGELRQEPVRQAFTDTEARVYLGAQTTAVPFIQGYRLSTVAGAWFVGDLHLVRRLADGGVIPDSLGAEDQAELQEFNAAGLLTRDVGDRSELRLCDQGERFRDLYAPDQCGWFALSPISLELDLTNRCNQNCVHCCRNSSPQAPIAVELSSRKLLLILDEAADIGVDEVSFLGGEPTLHPHLIELAYFARKRGIHRLNLATNALVLSEELVQVAAPLFTHIQISLHGATAETHETIVRHPGAFDRVLRNVSRLKTLGANVVLAYTVMASNRQELPEMLDLGRRLGVDGIRFIPLAGEGRGQDLPALELSDYQAVGKFISQARERKPGMDVTSGGFPTGEETPPDALFYGCIAGLTKLYLNSQGIASGCSLLGPEHLSGRNRSLLDIWHEKDMRRIRRRMECDCPFVTRCAGGCLSVPKRSQAVKLGVRNGKQG